MARVVVTIEIDVDEQDYERTFGEYGATESLEYVVELVENALASSFTGHNAWASLIGEVTAQ